MKEFKKWWKSEERHTTMCADVASEYAWKAALEWVQSRLEFGSEVAYSTDDILMAVKKEIREELEN